MNADARVTARAKRIPRVLCAVVPLLVSMAASAATGDPQTEIPRSPPYAAGGIGSDELDRLNARAGEFNLKLVFTLTEGNYVSDVAVVVKDRNGRVILAFTAPGPLAFAKLPRGLYTVETTYDGNTQVRKVDLRERLRTEYVRWPSNPESDFPGPKATERN